MSAGSPFVPPQTVLITGGASGIGRATAELFLARGWKVAIADLNEETATKMLEEVDAGDALGFIRTDVRDEAQIVAAVTYVRERFGAIGCMCNNAGLGGAFGPLTEIEAEDWDFTFEVLVRGPFLGIKHAARAMREQGLGGSIVNTGSTGALGAGLSPQAYTTAKSAIFGLTRAAAIELADDRIRVNTVNPGTIATPLTSPTYDMELGKAFQKALPWPDQGLPEDIARAIFFFADQDSGFITGEMINVDGGMIANGPMAGLAPAVGGPTSVVGVNRGMTGEKSEVRRRL